MPTKATQIPLIESIVRIIRVMVVLTYCAELAVLCTSSKRNTLAIHVHRVPGGSPGVEDPRSCA